MSFKQHHRKFHWCRRENGFSDMPVWRVVAARTALPLVAVLAFVNRLEEFANAAIERGGQRGSVADFSAAEFGAALDMAPEDAARIFAALADPAIGWVAFEHITNFHPRNPDKEDNRAADRVRRMRARKKAMEFIAGMAARGQIAGEQRPLLESQVLNDVPLEEAIHRLRCYDVTLRNSVTVTPEQSISSHVAAVDNNIALARGETAAEQGAAGSSDPHSPQVAPAGASSTGGERYDVTPAAVDNSDAAAWLANEGARIVVERMNVHPQRAALLIERFGRDLDDPMALAAIISAADNPALTSAQFHVLVSTQVARHVRAKAIGQPLPLGPVRLGPAPPATETESPAHPATGDAIATRLRKAAG